MASVVLSAASEPLTGFSGRQLTLLLCNVVLFILGGIVFIIGCVFLDQYRFAELSFVSQLFSVAPGLLIAAGLLTSLVALFGLILWKRKQEMSRYLRMLALLLPLATVLSLSAAVATFLLREVVASYLPNSDVTAQLLRYYSDGTMKARWDTLQRTYSCCGGHEEGYKEWATEAGLKRVPDSCCIEERDHCGEEPFYSQVAIPPIDKRLHTRGCMVVIKEQLHGAGMSMLMTCALAALIAALLELLLSITARWFADHVKKIKDFRRSTLSLDRSSSAQWTQGQDHYSTISSRRGMVSPTPSQGHVAYSLVTPVASPDLGLEVIREGDETASLADGSQTGPSSLIYHQEQPQESQPQPNSMTNTIERQSANVSREIILSTKQNVSKWASFWSALLPGMKQNKREVSQDEIHLERRKEALREDALDRESALMEALKNVVEASKERDESDNLKTKSKLSSFFGFRSKSKEDVLEDGAEPRRLKDRKYSKAKSMDALHEKHEKQQSAGSKLSKSIIWASAFFSRKMTGAGGSAETTKSETDLRRATTAPSSSTESVLETYTEEPKPARTTPSPAVPQPAPAEDKAKDEADAPDTKVETVVEVEVERERVAEEESKPDREEQVEGIMKASEADEESKPEKPMKTVVVIDTKEERELDRVAKTSVTRISVPAEQHVAKDVDVASQTSKVHFHKRSQQFQHPGPLSSIQRRAAESIDMVGMKKQKSETDLLKEQVSELRRKNSLGRPTVSSNTGTLAPQRHRHRRSESVTRLPYHKPTTIGSSEDILMHQAMTQTMAGPKSLPYEGHHATYEDIKIKSRKASHIPTPTNHHSTLPRPPSAANNSGPPRPMSPGLDDDFAKIRISGFGLELLEGSHKETKTTQSPEPKPQSPIRRQSRKELEDLWRTETSSPTSMHVTLPGPITRRISAAVKEVEAEVHRKQSSPTRKESSSTTASLRKASSQTGPAEAHGSLRKASSQSSAEVHSSHGIKGFLQKTTRRLSRSSHSHSQDPDGQQWKEDKIRRMKGANRSSSGVIKDSSLGHETSTEESDSTEQMLLQQSGPQQSLSEGTGGTSEEDTPSKTAEEPTYAELKKLRSPQFFLNPKDGSIVAAFDPSPETKARQRGRSQDDMHALRRKESQEQSKAFAASLDRPNGRSQSAPGARRRSAPAPAHHYHHHSHAHPHAPPARSSTRPRLILTADSSTQAWFMLQKLKEQEGKHLHNRNSWMEEQNNG